VNYFTENDNFSNKFQSDVIAALPKYFSDISAVAIIPGAASPVQQMGTDLLLVLNSGRKIAIDYKVRHGQYADVMFEYEVQENDGTLTPGFVNKPELANDFLLFYFPDRNGATMLFEMSQYKTLFRNYHKEWMTRAAKGEEGFQLRQSPAKGRAGTYYKRLLFIPRREYYLKVYQFE
jgi:hypothetical protein